MKHAFVIPAYRESPFLRQSIDSLLAQRRRSDIVVTTATPCDFIDQACRDFDLPLLINPAAPGIASDWNFALAATDADLVTLAHQDDLFFEDYSEAMIAAFQRHPSATLAFTDHVEHTADGPRATTLNLRIKRWLTWRAFRTATSISGRRRKQGLLSWGNPVSCPSVTIHRRLIPDFRFSDCFQINLDWDAWCRLAEADGEFVYLPRQLVAHRVHAGTETTASIADRRRYNEDLQMLRRFWSPGTAQLILSAYQLSYRGNQSR